MGGTDIYNRGKQVLRLKVHRFVSICLQVVSFARFAGHKLGKVEV